MVCNEMVIDVVSSFDRYAEDYDLWYREEPGSSIFESEIRALETFGLRGIGIEIGVGTGVFSSRLDVSIGLDPSIKMVKMSKSRGISVVQGLGEFLPFKSACLDYVLILFTICFLKTPAVSIRETHRVLKQGGRTVVGFVPRNSMWGRLYLKKGSRGHRFFRHVHFYTLDEVETLLENEGFKVEGYSATLSQAPDLFMGVESPSSDVNNCGFVCVGASR